MFCLKSYRKGLSGTPVAIETAVCWFLLGTSLSPSISINGKVNFVKKCASGKEHFTFNKWKVHFQTNILSQIRVKTEKLLIQ